MARVIVLIDGSNVIGALGRTGLGYPALGPIACIRGSERQPRVRTILWQSAAE